MGTCTYSSFPSLLFDSGWLSKPTYHLNPTLSHLYLPTLWATAYPIITMRFLCLAATLALAAAASVQQEVKRAPPKHDLYIFEDHGCKDRVGEICEGYEDGNCCAMGDNKSLGTSAEYRDQGSSTPSSEFEISVYSRLPTTQPNGREVMNMCGVRMTKHDKCADGAYLSVSGAMVHSGSDTITRRAGKMPTQVTATKYFHLDGKKRWTIAIDSDLGRSYASLPKSQRVAYLKEHGEQKLLN
jgi:hypothetical protein